MTVKMRHENFLGRGEWFADVHPDEVENYKLGDWRVVDEPAAPVAYDGSDDSVVYIPEDWDTFSAGELKALAREIDPGFSGIKADAEAVVLAALEERGE